MALHLLCWGWPPLSLPRAVQTARLVGAVRRGPVRVWTVDPGSAPGVGGVDPTVPGADGAGVADVVRVPTRLSTRARGIGRKLLGDRVLLPDAAVAWCGDALRFMRRHAHMGPSDVLVTFGAPMSAHLAGRALKRELGVCWIAHFSDPWSDNPFRSHGALVKRLNRRMEDDVLRDCDGAIYTNDAVVDLVFRSRPRAWREKAYVLPHCYRPEDFSDTPSAGDDDKVVFRYLGGFYGPRQPNVVIEALARLGERAPEVARRVRLEFVGTQERHLDVATLLGRVPEGSVRIEGRVAYGESLRLMSAADVLLNIDAPAEQSVFLPSKLIDYLGARRPILGVTPPGPAADLIRSVGGRVVDPTSSDEVGDGLAWGVEVAEAPDPEGASKVRESYRSHAVAERFEEIIAEVLGQRSATRSTAAA